MPEQVVRKTTRKNKRKAVPARERLLHAATHLFCRYGINSIGVDTIVAEAGTAKATLYNTFGSKEALACEVLDREGRKWREWLFGEIDAFDGDSRSKLLHIFDALEIWFRDRQYFGCPFINAVAEHDKLDERLRAIALDHKEIVLARIVALARDADMPAPEQMAHQLAIVIDGSIVAALITRKPGMALVARGVAEAILGNGANGSRAGESLA
ncbi:MAG: TetR/AcrR family transcriptional regulator [Hyphomicrobiales bacterium]|nr:TetR/AcrR family transcriptional regulator [Hyphomicrobiales bacterium]